MPFIRRSAWALGVALVLVTGLALGGWLLLSSRAASPGPTAGTAESPGPGVIHVHGLGINPRDGTLYAATHSGLFAIPAQGRARRVADRFQDTMAFTVTGADAFLASGHPDLRAYQRGELPPLLGLITSSDAGATWEPLSLLGQSDFHVLRIAGGRVYGYDSTGGALLVTENRRDWVSRSRLELLDFVVDPADPDLLVAITPAGLQQSRDGGATWQPLPGPDLALLGWDETAGLWGLTGTGAVYRSIDRGTTWQQTGMAGGPPEAMLVSPDGLYVAVTGQGIRFSADGGQRWQVRYQEEDSP